jgi:EpsI family protein
MTTRAIVLVVLLGAAGHLVSAASPRPVHPAAPLASLPLRLSSWQGVPGPAVEPDVERVLAADEYVNRIYRRGGDAVVGLWVAFYSAQRQGDAIHSPLNCLPGTGWTTISHSRPMIQVAGSAFPVNRYVVQKRGARQVVMYWFQGRNRIVASEYANKMFLLVDAIRHRRTDGALVRIVVPIRGDERVADGQAISFINALHGQLARRLP